MWYKWFSIKQFALLVGLAALSFTACKKSSSSSNAQYEQLGTTNASDVSSMENVNTDIESIGDLSAVIAVGNTGFYGLGNIFQLEGDFDTHHYHHDGNHNGDDDDDFSRCAMISFNSSLTTRVLTIDFGTSDCTGVDGTNRRGQIIITFTGNFLDSGSTHTFTFNNYFVNDNQLTGSKTVTYTGTNSSGQPTYAINVSDTLWLGSNNGYLAYNSQRTRTWTQGYNTYKRSDDVFLISGTSTTREADGSVINATITNPLQVAPTCKWIEAGTISFTDQNHNVEYIDYGSGNCDSEAQLTINGHVYNITLH